MQDPKKINVSGAVNSNGKTYSVEFHEDNHDTNIKVVDRGVASYYPVGGGSGVKTFEFWTDSGVTSNINENTFTEVIMDGNPYAQQQTITSSSNLYDGGRILDFSTLSVGQAVALTYAFYVDNNLAGGVSGGHFNLDLQKHTGTDNLILSLGGGEPSNDGQWVTGTVIIPVIDSGTASWGGSIHLGVIGTPVRFVKKFVGITVL